MYVVDSMITTEELTSVVLPRLELILCNYTVIIENKRHVLTTRSLLLLAC